jgi:hypothetical protein
MMEPFAVSLHPAGSVDPRIQNLTVEYEALFFKIYFSKNKALAERQ